MDEYNVHIGDDKITLYNMKNSWKWYQIISIDKKRAVEYRYDIDNGLVVRYYKQKKERCFEIIKNKSIGMLERPVYIIDEETLSKILETCYELEHVSY